MKKKKTVKIIIIIAAVVVVIAAALILVRVLNKNKKADVISVSMINDSWLATEQGNYTGFVSTGRIQNVKLLKALVESVNVKVGDHVNVGDTLMVYDRAEYQIALLNAEAEIAVLESQIDKAQRAAAKYASLKPSEEAPEPWEEIIDHGELPIKKELKADDLKEDESSFLITLETKIGKDFLKKLREKKYVVELIVYEGYANFATYYLDGAEIPKLVDEFVVKGEEPSSEEDSSEEASSEEPSSEEPSSEEPTTQDTKEYKRVQVDPIKKDWQLKNVIEYTEFGGIAKVGTKVNYYGEAEFYEPVIYERYEIIIHYPEIDPESGNYIYSRAELAQMIMAANKEAQELKCDLLIAQIKLQKDKLTADTGEVKATVSGVVTDIADISHAGIGDTVITIKGSENYSVMVYVDELSLNKFNVGDEGTVTTYESGNSTSAKVTEIESAPVSSYYGYGSANPVSSYYPVTMVVDSSDVEMVVGEYCQVQMNSDGEATEKICIPLMYVRSDEKGHYCMVAENNRLKKRYVQTGANYWGSEIEIKQGLSVDDYIAFPYGAGENEGAPVNITEDFIW